MGGKGENLRGAVFMMLAMAGYVLNDTMIKLASADLELAQAVFMRGLAVSTLLGLLAWQQGALRYRPKPSELRIVLWRAFGEIAATFCFLTGLFHMPLPNATAILQSLPLAVALGASVFLGQKVGWQRYGAILVGFGGVLLIVQPGGSGFNIYALWVVAAVGFVTLRELTTSRLPASTPSLFVALFTAVGVTAVAGIGAVTQEWQAVPLRAWLELGSAAGFILVGYVAGVAAMRHGDIAFVSPFRYTVLIWAILLGLIAFGDIPDFWALTGICIIVAAGVFTLWREQVVSRKQAAPITRQPE